MPYIRVIPRDLFNEAKLLKCLGQLSLMIHDGKAPRLSVEHEDPESGFPIEQNPDDGSIYCPAIVLMLDGDREIPVSSPLNSRDAYPLRFVWGDDIEGAVFDDAGRFSAEFAEFLETTDS